MYVEKKEPSTHSKYQCQYSKSRQSVAWWLNVTNTHTHNPAFTMK